MDENWGYPCDLSESTNCYDGITGLPRLLTKILQGRGQGRHLVAASHGLQGGCFNQ